MKKFLIAISLLALTACGTNGITASRGEIVSCNSIHHVAVEEDMTLTCLDGGAGIAPQALRGPMIVNVWGTWCGPCKKEIPILVRFAAQKTSIQLVGIDVEEKNIDAGRKYVLNHGITWPNLYDSDGSTRSQFGMGVPVTWFIDADGRVAYKKIGPVKSLDELNALAKRYLGAA